jgi:hypothetical protein
MANEDIQIFVKAQKEDFAKCLPPSMDCDENPIRAHSIQNARVLDLIQTDGHVRMPQYKPRFASPERNHGSRAIATDFCNKICHKQTWRNLGGSKMIEAPIWRP